MYNKETKEAVTGLLTENTGKHFLDSGGENGRAWQRNQGRDFEAEKPTTAEFRVNRYEKTVWFGTCPRKACARLQGQAYGYMQGRKRKATKIDRGGWNKYGYGSMIRQARWTTADLRDSEKRCSQCATLMRISGPFYVTEVSLEINVTHNLYHWLAEKVNYEDLMTRAFKRWASAGERKSKPWLALMEEWVERNIEKGRFQHMGDGGGMTVNSCNNEDLLSQTIQWVGFADESGTHHALLQIHGGADVRGGYSSPIIVSMDEYALLDNARASMGCTECDAGWYSDDGHSWYPNDREVDLKRGGDVPEGQTVKQAVHDSWSSQPPAWWVEGTVFVDEEHNALCPECGCGQLVAGFY